jgi:hypothetical protein
LGTCASNNSPPLLDGMHVSVRGGKHRGIHSAACCRVCGEQLLVLCYRLHSRAQRSAGGRREANPALRNRLFEMVPLPTEAEGLREGSVSSVPPMFCAAGNLWYGVHDFSKGSRSLRTFGEGPFDVYVSGTAWVVVGDEAGAWYKSSSTFAAEHPLCTSGRRCWWYSF